MEAVMSSIDKTDKQGVPIDEAEQEAIADARTEKVKTALGKFIEYSEYVTIEFDTDVGSARVVPLKELKS